MEATLPLEATSVTAEGLVSYVEVHEPFEVLYRREYPGLYAVATALSGPAESEDLVQDTMFKAFVHYDKVARLDRPGGWCHRVLVNACRNLWHKKNRQHRILSRQRFSNHVDEPSSDIVDFWRAVRQLPARPRMVVALYYAADRSTAEIASILDVPDGTVRSDLARARQALVAELGV